jgi:hypothetical protein
MRPIVQSSFMHFLCFIAAVCLFPRCNSAQSVHLQHQPYVESFVGKPKVSGNLLVGLRFGAVAGNFNPRSVGLLIPANSGWRSACVDISSRDGLYFAENMYNIDGASGGFASIQSATKYFDELLRYKNEDIAVTVRLVSDCNAPEVGDIVPAILSASAPSPTRPANLPLMALVNAEPDRLHVALLKNGAEVAAAICASDLNAVQISFTSSCAFKGSPALPPGSYDLLIRVRERFAARDSHFSVQLP